MKAVKSHKTNNKPRKLRLIVTIVAVFGLVLIAVGAAVALTRNDEPAETPTVEEIRQETVPEVTSPPIEEAETKEPEPAVSQYPVTYSLTEAANLTVVVNKKHKLPSEYAPSLQAIAGGQLRPEAANALANLLADAENAGNPMIIVSSYRSYNTQVSTYQYWVDTQGKAEADRSSARPGHSEHQTGLAVDLGNPDGSCRLLACFGSGAAGTWLANNAHKYGFIIRYPDGKESLTGYIYEPWHARYVGVDVATAIKNSGQTMDQYYGVEAGDY